MASSLSYGGDYLLLQKAKESQLKVSQEIRDDPKVARMLYKSDSAHKILQEHGAQIVALIAAQRKALKAVNLDSKLSTVGKQEKLNAILAANAAKVQQMDNEVLQAVETINAAIAEYSPEPEMDTATATLNELREGRYLARLERILKPIEDPIQMQKALEQLGREAVKAGDRTPFRVLNAELPSLLIGKQHLKPLTETLLTKVLTEIEKPLLSPAERASREIIADVMAALPQIHGQTAQYHMETNGTAVAFVVGYDAGTRLGVSAD